MDSKRTAHEARRAKRRGNNKDAAEKNSIVEIVREDLGKRKRGLPLQWGRGKGERHTMGVAGAALAESGPSRGGIKGGGKKHANYDSWGKS